MTRRSTWRTNREPGQTSALLSNLCWHADRQAAALQLHPPRLLAPHAVAPVGGGRRVSAGRKGAGEVDWRASASTTQSWLLCLVICLGSELERSGAAKRSSAAPACGRNQDTKSFVSDLLPYPDRSLFQESCSMLCCLCPSRPHLWSGAAVGCPCVWASSGTGQVRAAGMFPYRILRLLFRQQQGHGAVRPSWGLWHSGGTGGQTSSTDS